MVNKEKIIEFFQNDLFAVKQLGAKIVDVDDNYAKCEFNVNENHKNAKGIIMGGAIFTLADFTFAVATNQSDEYYTVSTCANINYYLPGLGEKLYAEAIKIKDGKMVCFYDVLVKDEKDNLIAKLSISGTHIKKN